MAVTPGYPRRKARSLSSSAGRNGWVKPPTSRPCGPPSACPGTDQEVVAALGKPKTDADHHQRDEHRRPPCGIDDPVTWLRAKPANAITSPPTDTASSRNTARSEDSDVTLDSSRNSRW